MDGDLQGGQDEVHGPRHPKVTVGRSLCTGTRSPGQSRTHQFPWIRMCLPQLYKASLPLSSPKDPAFVSRLEFHPSAPGFILVFEGQTLLGRLNHSGNCDWVGCGECGR